MPKTPLSFYLHMIAVAVIVFAVGTYVSSRTTDRAEGSAATSAAGDSSSASSVARSDKKESAYDRVMRTGVIRCGYGIYAPSLSVDVNTKEFSGFAVDIMNEIVRRLDLKIEWAEETGYGNIAESLNSGKIDAFCVATGLNTHRAKFTLATDVLFYAPTFIAVRADDARFAGNSTATVNEESVRILVVDGDITDTIARNNFPKAKRISVPQLVDRPQMLQDVIAGKADAVLVEPFIFNQFDKNNPKKLRIIDMSNPVNLLPVAFVVNKNEVQLKHMFDLALMEMRNEGLLKKIYVKHIPDPNIYFYPAAPYQLPSQKN